ncbi:MAG TPA: hypothetical protein VF807_01685 [Ktedonobacterales bacterium]
MGTKNGAVRQEGSGAAPNGDSQEITRDLLRQIPEASKALLDELDAVGLTRSVRGAPACSLHILDRSLPRQSFDDLHTACEAYAFITAPSALSRGDVQAVAAEAESLLATFDALLYAATKRLRIGRGTSASTSVQAPLLRMAIESAGVHEAVAHLADLFEQLASSGGATGHRRRSRLSAALPVGRRFLMPGIVLLVVLALIIVLVSAVSLANGHQLISNPLGNKAATSAPLTGSAASPTALPATQPAGQTPTASRTPKPTTPPASGAQLTVSQLSQASCADRQAAQFTISYPSGQGALAWTATVDNAANVAISVDGTTFSDHVSGSLQPSQQATVYVRGLTDATGQITVTHATSAVSYDTTNICGA